MNSTSARRVRGEPDLEEILLRLSGNMKLSLVGILIADWPPAIPPCKQKLGHLHVPFVI